MKKNKAILLYQILGDHLPKEVLSKLTTSELMKLHEGIENSHNPSRKEEQSILTSFLQNLTQRKKSQDEFSLPSFSEAFSGSKGEEVQLLEEIQSLLENDNEFTLDHETLGNFREDELIQLMVNEPEDRMAGILLHANPEVSTSLLERMDPITREEVLIQMIQKDWQDSKIQEEFYRFLQFKLTNSNGKKIHKNQGAKVAGQLLSRMPQSASEKIIQSIQKSEPKSAEVLRGHFVQMEELLDLDYKPFESFFSGIHPLVIACALKGVSEPIKDQFFHRFPVLLKLRVQEEFSSLGPVSLAEIETAQNGIQEELEKEWESGSLSLWKKGK
jgi:flagellar motor switch protein FliG